MWPSGYTPAARPADFSPRNLGQRSLAMLYSAAAVDSWRFAIGTQLGTDHVDPPNWNVLNDSGYIRGTLIRRDFGHPHGLPPEPAMSGTELRSGARRSTSRRLS